MSETVYNTFVLTDKGAALLNRAQAGMCRMEFTRASAGDGTWDDKTPEGLREAEALRNPVKDFPIAASQTIDSLTVMVAVRFGNEGITQGFFINEIGIFAGENGTAGTEILYAIAVCSGEHGSFLPAYNGHNAVSINQQFYITVDNSLEAVINIGSQYMLYDPLGIAGTPGALVPMQDLSDIYAEHVQDSSECTEQDIRDIIGGDYESDEDDTGQIDDDGTVIEEATDEEVQNVMDSLWNN